MAVIALSADPTVLATAGAQGQLGTFGGNLYIHDDGPGASTNWTNLTALVLAPFAPLRTLTADPTGTATIAPAGTLGLFGGNVYVHKTAASDTNWLKLAGVNAPLLVTLGADPTSTPPGTNYPPGTVGVWPGSPDQYFWKVASTNQASSSGVPAAWHPFNGSLQQLLADYDKQADGAYSGGNLWAVLNSVANNGGGSYFNAILARIHNAGVGNMLYQWGPSVNFGSFLASVGMSSVTLTYGGPPCSGAKYAGAAAHIGTAFGGGAVATAHISIGDGRGVDSIIKALDATDPTAGGTVGSGTIGGDWSGPITITLTVTGDTLDHLTAGDIDFTIYFFQP